jgi:hypothetical protein
MSSIMPNEAFNAGTDAMIGLILAVAAVNLALGYALAVCLKHDTFGLTLPGSLGRHRNAAAPSKTPAGERD